MSVNSVRHKPRSRSACSFPRSRFIIKGTKTDHLSSSSTGIDVGSPLSATLVPIDAAITGRGPLVARYILHVLSTRESSQVDSSVVEFVTVDVVPLAGVFGRQSQQLSVKKNCAPNIVRSVGSSNVGSVRTLPEPLRGPRSVLCVNERMDENSASLSIQWQQGSRSICTQYGCGRRALVPAALRAVTLIRGRRKRLTACCAVDWSTSSARYTEARSRAKASGGGIVLTYYGKKFLAARLAGARNGTLSGHWEFTSPDVPPRRCRKHLGASSRLIVPFQEGLL